MEQYIVVNGQLSIGSLIGFNIFSSRALVLASGAQIIFKFDWFKYSYRILLWKVKRFKREISGMQLNTVTGNIKLSKIDFSYNKSDFYSEI